MCRKNKVNVPVLARVLMYSEKKIFITKLEHLRRQTLKNLPERTVSGYSDLQKCIFNVGSLGTRKLLSILSFMRKNSTLRYECDETFSDECEFAARAEGE